MIHTNTYLKVVLKCVWGPPLRQSTPATPLQQTAPTCDGLRMMRGWETEVKDLNTEVTDVPVTVTELWF